MNEHSLTTSLSILGVKYWLLRLRSIWSIFPRGLGNAIGSGPAGPIFWKKIITKFRP